MLRDKPLEQALMVQFDLTNSMGNTVEFSHPAFGAAVARANAACQGHGNAAALMATDREWAREFPARGFPPTAYGIDPSLVQASPPPAIASPRNARAAA